MKKRILSIVLAISLLSACIPAVNWIVAAVAVNDTIEFCGIELTGEMYDYESGEFTPLSDAWVAGTEEYQGVTDYLMSTNCDKGELTWEDEQYNDTIYAVSFTMPYTGYVSFQASVSGEDWCDCLMVLVDEQDVYNTYDIYDYEWAETPWIDVSVMAKKDQKVSICYTKDGSVTEGEDRAFIADLELTDLGIVFSDEIADTSWYDSEQYEFEIGTKEELSGFSVLVNEGVTFEDCVITLTADIDMSGVVWIPAGQYNFDMYGMRLKYTDVMPPSGMLDIPGLNTCFMGEFDGAGYSIDNLYVKYTYPQTTYIGFIAMNFGIIHDLVLNNPVIGDGDIAKSAGAIAGYNGGAIIYCAVNGGEVNITWDRYFMAYAGGAVGTNGYAFTMPYFTELNNAGGLIAASYSTADVQVQYTRSGWFGSPDEDTEGYLAIAGGFVGAAYGGMIAECYSRGDVTAIAEKPEGILYATATPPVVNDTFAISGSFIGMILSAMPESEVQPDGYVEEPEEPEIALIMDCYATGAVTATGPSAATSLASGFLGFARNMTPAEATATYLLSAENCYFDNQTTGKTTGFKKAADFEGITGMASANMKIEENYENWEFDEMAWQRYDSINDGYPVLDGVGIGCVSTVIFEDYDGTVLDTQYVSNGGDATAPTAPTREGYTFIGWDSELTGITEDMTVTALYNVNQVNDPESDVTVEGVDGTSLDEDTVLVATLVTDTVDPADIDAYNIKIQGLSDGKELVDLFDIHLLLNNAPIQPDGTVRVKIKLTEAQLAYEDLEIIYIDDEGNITIIPSTIKDGYIIFETDHFSNYGIIGTPVVPEATADTPLWPLVALLLAVMGAGYGVTKKSKLRRAMR